jgi:hypothetical protein
MLEVTIVGNGPSRKDIDLTEIGHEVWGCNAIYRDTTCCDIVFAVDMPVQQEIVESGYYLGNLVAFADIDPIPMEMMGMFQPTLHNVTVTKVESDSHFIIQGDDSGTQFLGLTRPELIVVYNYPELKNLFTGMSALGYAMMQGYEKINLIGFDALEGDSYENIYEGSENYLHKYNTDSRVLTAQRSQFIALLEWYYGKGSVYFRNPLDKEDEIKYNELPYYESSKEWILGQDWLGDEDGLF